MILDIMCIYQKAAALIAQGSCSLSGSYCNQIIVWVLCKIQKKKNQEAIHFMLYSVMCIKFDTDI